MYSVVISDQSPSLVLDMKKFIEDNFKDITIAACFNNSTEVVDFLKNHSADIIICSVDSQSQTGLAVAQYVYEHKLETQVILTVSHHQLSGIKDAVDYKVSGLLLKPFYPQDIICSVQLAKNKISEDLATAYKLTRSYLIEWEWKKQNLTLVYNSITSLDELFEKDIACFKQYPLNKLNCAEVQIYLQNYTKRFAESKSNIKHLYKSLQDIAEGETATFSAFQVREHNMNVNYIVFYENAETGLNDFTENIKKSVKSLYGLELKIKINRYKTIKELVRARKNTELITAFLESLVVGNISKSHETANEISSETNPERLKEFYNEINEHLVTEYNIDLNLSGILEKCSTEKQVLTEVLRKAEALLSESRCLVVSVKDYVRNHFTQDITVEEIAREFSMSAGYLGRVFKEETGQKLIDFMLDVKFNKAKELLVAGNYSVTEVAHLVGYNQTKYFGVVFKKRTGLTPSEFVKQSKQLYR